MAYELLTLTNITKREYTYLIFDFYNDINKKKLQKNILYKCILHFHSPKVLLHSMAQIKFGSNLQINIFIGYIE